MPAAIGASDQFMSKIIAIDWETFYSKKLKYTLKTTIAERYCRHQLFDPYLLSVCDGTQSWAGSPKDFNWESLEGAILLSHNRYFDNNVYNEMMRRGWAPKINFAAWHCTANLTAYLCNRRALADAVEYLFKVKLDKQVRSDANNKHWPQDFSADEQAAMLEYAKDDALWTWKLWDKFSHLWPLHEQRISNMTIDQGMRGVKINRDLLETFIIQSHDMKLATEKTLPWIAGAEDDKDESWDEFSAKPTSTKCIAEQCRRSGIPCPPVKKHEGEEAYEEWELTYSRTNPWIPALSTWRSVNKLYKTFLTAKERLRDDGTMPFELKYWGAHTGRWSGGAKLNFQNFRKVPIFCRKQDGLMETSEKAVNAAMKEQKKTGKYPDWVKGEPIDFRRLIVPRPGTKLISSDLSQIEPRVLAWLAGDEKLLALIRQGYGVYEAFARANMGWTGGSLKDEDPDQYQMIKIMVLGLGFGCGWEKYISIAAEYEVDLCATDPEFIETRNPFTGEIKKVSGYGTTSKKIVNEFREKSPKTKGLWQQLDDAFKRSIGETFEMQLPSGRSMRYDKVRADTRIEKDPETGKPIRRTEMTAEVGGKRKKFYGGKLTENIVQATARDVMAFHLLALEDAGLRVLFHVHDEAICEVDNHIQACDVKNIMSYCPTWLAGCPISADAKEIPFYLK